MRKLLVIISVSFLAGCSKPQEAVEPSTTEFVLQNYETVSSRVDDESRPAIFMEDTTEEDPYKDYTDLRITTGWFVTVLLNGDKSLEYKVVSQDELFSGDTLNLYLDKDGVYIDGLLKSGLEAEVFGLGEDDHDSLLQGKEDAILRIAVDDWVCYAAFFSYSNDVTIITYRSDTPVFNDKLYVAYEGKTLSLEQGVMSTLVLDSDKSEVVSEVETDMAVEETLTGDTSGVTYDADEVAFVVDSASGKLHVYDLKLNNYEVIVDEFDTISLKLVDSDELFSVSAFSDTFDSKDYEVIEYFNSGYTLYQISDVQFVLAADDASWFYIDGISLDYAVDMFTEMVG